MYKIEIQTEDISDIKKIAKADDMAMFIWELKNNAWRQFKHKEVGSYDYNDFCEVISELLDEHNIFIDDLVQ